VGGAATGGSVAVIAESSLTGRPALFIVNTVNHKRR